MMFMKIFYLFDLSDYPQNSKFSESANKKVIGKIKDQFKGKIISEFIGLKSKVYSLIVVHGKQKKKDKRSQQKCC